MKDIRKKAALIIAIAVNINAFATDNQQEKQFYQFLELGIENYEFYSDTKSGDIESSWSPKIGLGAGYQLQLSENWQLENELSIDYSTVNIIKRHSTEKHYGNVELLGLWGTTRLKRNNVFENVSPFFELKAGLVNVDYQVNNTRSKDNNTVLKASVGLQFSLENDTEVDLSLGVSDNNDI